MLTHWWCICVNFRSYMPFTWFERPTKGFSSRSIYSLLRTVVASIRGIRLLNHPWRRHRHAAVVGSAVEIDLRVEIAFVEVDAKANHLRNSISHKIHNSWS